MSNLILNPWSSLDSIFDDFNKVFAYRSEESYPAVQTHQSEKGIELRFELPGVDPDKVELNYEDDTLIIKGERQELKTKNEQGYVRRERQYGTFERSFVLPWKVDESKIKARYKNGLLIVELLKELAQSPKKITIQTKGVA